MQQTNWKELTEALLELSGLSPAELAKRLGVSRQAVYRWLNAETEPRRTQRDALFHFTVDLLRTHLERARREKQGTG